VIPGKVAQNQLCLVWTKQNGAKAPRNEKGGTNMNKTSKEILSYFITVMKETLEKMIKEERQAYLEENAHTKANGSVQ